jgi:nucleotide-binding universal stress UspA family protein
MDQVVLLCVDGSEASIHAAETGLARLAPGRTIVATVVAGVDPTMVTGVSGMAGGAMSPDEMVALEERSQEAGEEILDAAVATLGLGDAERVVLMGEPGIELVLHAGDVGATVIVVGSQGKGRLKRVFLGSVSEHLVRNAPCPVLVVRQQDED